MGRSPRGERGLKYYLKLVIVSRGIGRSPRGERGLKYQQQVQHLCNQQGRSPRGERGLKLGVFNHYCLFTWSLSSRRAWIEIVISLIKYLVCKVALLAESVD